MSERAIITGYALADMDERRKLEAEVERLRGLLKAADEVLWNAPAPSTNEVGTDYYEAWQRWERLRVEYPEIGGEG